MNKFLILLLLIIIYAIFHKEGFIPLRFRLIKQKEDDYKKMWKENNYIQLYNIDIPENIKKFYSYDKDNEMDYSLLKQYNKELPNNIPNDTKCIYSFKSPSASKNINLDIEDPYKRYSTQRIKNDKYQFNYFDESPNLNLDFYKQEKLKYSPPYFKYYSYCNLDKNSLPTCSLITCNNEQKHRNTLRLISNENKKIDKGINETKLQMLRRHDLYNDKKFNSESNSYLNKVLRY